MQFFLLLLLCAPLQDTTPDPVRRCWQYVRHLYQTGNLAESQRQAGWGFQQYKETEPLWAERFLLLEAEAAMWRGYSGDAERMLALYRPAPDAPDDNLRAHLLSAIAASFQLRFDFAQQQLDLADAQCRERALPSCGELFKAHGSLMLAQENYQAGWDFNMKAHAWALSHQDANLEMRSALNLGQAALALGRLDLAQQWSGTAYRLATEQGNEDLASVARSNQALAAFPFGEDESGSELLRQAAQSAARLGNLRNEYIWRMYAGEEDAYVFHFLEGVRELRRSVELAQRLGDKEKMWYACLHLGSTLVWSGNPHEGSPYLLWAQANTPPGERSRQLAVGYALAMAAELEDRLDAAEAGYREVLADESPGSIWRFDAASRLGAILARRGRSREAEALYKKWLAIFEYERGRIADPEARMNYLLWGQSLYSASIEQLQSQGKPEEALLLAEAARAHSLRNLFGGGSKSLPVLHPRQIAARAHAVVLDYWLGREKGYFWIITPHAIRSFALPGARDLVPLCRRYRDAILKASDPLSSRNPDGRTLYQMLIAPAAALLPPGAPVIVIADGELNTLNFETLIAPARQSGFSEHYWIEDAEIRQAPSLTALVSARPPAHDSGRILLIGDSLAVSRDYPELPLAPVEMKLIERHFPIAATTARAREQATPNAYLQSHPEQFSYIHFAAHGTASRLDPLDSSILLSPAREDRESFRLYARQILEHPIDARLVTISACYGNGTRLVAGQGLVGLSWAFLHAGAHHVIGSLWEVSDDSSPRLMDELYAGLQSGMTPQAALRVAKLAQLHSGVSSYQLPFYWAAFQDYTRH